MSLMKVFKILYVGAVIINILIARFMLHDAWSAIVIVLFIGTVGYWGMVALVMSELKDKGKVR